MRRLGAWCTSKEIDVHVLVEANGSVQANCVRTTPSSLLWRYELLPSDMRLVRGSGTVVAKSRDTAMQLVEDTLVHAGICRDRIETLG